MIDPPKQKETKFSVIRPLLSSISDVDGALQTAHTIALNPAVAMAVRIGSWKYILTCLERALPLPTPAGSMSSIRKEEKK